MLTEGEASLHFCVADLLNTEATNQGGPQGVAVIDVGGGTIDLSMFSMTTSPISCEEIAPAECMQPFPTTEFLLPVLGRLQGSVFVTRRARLLLESWLLRTFFYAPINEPRKLEKLQGWEHSTPDEIAEFTREFDQTTKLVIKSDQEFAYVKVAGRKANLPKYNISFGKLKLTG